MKYLIEAIKTNKHSKKVKVDNQSIEKIRNSPEFMF